LIAINVTLKSRIKAIIISPYLKSLVSIQLLCSLFLLLCGQSVRAQEALGFKLGSYAGPDRIYLNPASAQSSSFKWEVNLASLHAFLFTDYAFIRKTSLLSLSEINSIQLLNLKSTVTENPTATSLIFDLDGGNKLLSGHIEIGGPAILTNFFFDMKVGVFTKIRANASTGKISENFGVYELNESFSSQLIKFEKNQISGMFWREIGIHLSKSLELFDVGVNIKRLDAYEGAFANVDTDQNLDYTNGILKVGSNELAGGVGYTRNGVYSNKFQLRDTNDHGKGVSIDLGVRFDLDELSLGVSLIDLGLINFRHHVENYALPGNYSDFDVDPQDYIEVSTLEELIDQVEMDSPFEPFFNHRGFKIGTPAGLNISADYSIDQNIFISASLTQRLKFMKLSTIRDNTLSVVPRFQSKWLSAYLPLTVYNYSRVRVGAAARLAYFTIGSEDLLSIFHKSDFRGSDVYVRLSITPLFKIKRRKKSRKISGSNAKCYEF